MNTNAKTDANLAMTSDQPDPASTQLNREAASNASMANDFRTALCGMMMGGADVVPGVSGGTVALILGIYDRLVTAISHFDSTFFGHLRRREWRDAAIHIDLRFLIALACGVAAGIGAMLVVTILLLENPGTRPFILGAFFGLIMSSGFIVVKSIKAEQSGTLQLGICATVGFAAALSIYYFTTFHAGESTSDPAMWYLFLCGMLAICAMILPGISGAMILVLLGTYQHIAHLPKNVLKGEHVCESLVEIGVVGLGCVIGLLAFSKLLRRLLADFRMPTMAVMCGFIFGALPKLWPFDKKLDEKHYEPIIPTDAGQIVGVVIVIVAAASIVLLAERIANRGDKSESTPDNA